MRAFEVNRLLDRHGETGSVLRTLRRCSMIGWLLFVAVLAVLLCVIAVVAVVPRPVLVVDGAGRVVGQIDWRPTVPARAQAVEATKRFVSDLLSMNSSTVFDEYARALNHMATGLRRRTIADLRKTGYLAQVEHAHLVSWVEFDHGGVSVRRASGRTLVVTLSGRVVIEAPSGQRRNPFHLAVTVRRIMRTATNGAGIEVSEVRALP